MSSITLPPEWGVYEQLCIEKQQQQHIVGGIKKAFNNRAFEFTGRVHT